ncbi:MAG TPA: hypothetical protein VF438_00895 [Candidatus Paceibacterota bacterium]
MPKAVKKAPVKKIEETEEIVPPSKIKKEVDLEAGEAFASSDKEDDVESFPADTDDSDELGDEAELDTEEVNPFGDKWEE